VEFYFARLLSIVEGRTKNKNGFDDKVSEDLQMRYWYY